MRRVDGGIFFLGIGFALVKQLGGVDIGFTLLALCLDPHRLLSTMCRWGFSFLLASDLQIEMMDFESLENRGFSTMGLPCKQCEKSMPVDDIFEFLYCDEGIYFFCSKECSDKWMSVNAQEIDPEILQQTSI
jgi:hypothetical protein